MRIVVTGGVGFIGSAFVRLYSSFYDLLVVDKIGYTHASKNVNINARLQVINITSITPEWVVNERPDIIINMAAETHVDRSITDSSPFIDSNIVGVQRILESIRISNHSCRLVQVSTDEVYGSSDGEAFTEHSVIKPNNPYSASKASADFLCLSYHHTYGLDVVITRCSNNYGPGQFREKLIPLAIWNVVHGKKVPVYGDGMQRRDWIHVDDHCRGIMLAAECGKSGEVYNFGTGVAITNIEIIKHILDIMEVGDDFIEYVKDRLGHDRLYLMDSTKAENELGWERLMSFNDGIRDTVRWYKDEYSCSR